MNNTIKDFDDVDDDLFISKKPQNYIFAEKKIQDVKEKTKSRMLNSRIMIEEAEKIGAGALENLSSQREQLERAENNLDYINTATRATQKHLNHMKSWGWFKGLFSSSNSNATVPPVPSIAANSGMPRSATIAQIPSSAGSSNLAPATGSQRVKFPDSTSRSSNVVDQQEPVDEFEADLNALSFGLGNLKEMASRLGDEIGDHNEMIDRITSKSERAEDSIKIQNRQMNQLLKK